MKKNKLAYLVFAPVMLYISPALSQNSKNAPQTQQKLLTQKSFSVNESQNQALPLIKGQLKSTPQSEIQSNPLPVSVVSVTTKPQDQAASEEKLQLAQLLNQSLEYNSDFLAEKLQQDAIYEKSHTAKAAFLPIVRWNTNTQLAYQDPKNSNSFTTRGIGTGLNIQQPIYQADRFIALDQAQITRQLTPLALDVSKQNLWLKIVQNYFNILKQQQNLETLEKKQKSIEQQRIYAQKSFDAGLTSITDVREAQSRLDNLLSQKITVQNQIDSQKKQLEVLTGILPQKLNLAKFNIDLAKIDVYRQNTFKDINPANLQNAKISSIKVAQLNLALAEKEYEKAKKADYPVLDAYANANYNASAGGSQSNNTQKSASIGLQLSVPLFTTTAKGIKIREMALLLSKSQQDLISTQRRWQERYTLIMQNLDSLISQNKALISALKSNQANLDATQLAYKVGLRINIDVLNAQDQLYETQKQLSQNEYDALIAALELLAHLNRLEDKSHLSFLKNN
jgi:outer membrane protein